MKQTTKTLVGLLVLLLVAGGIASVALWAGKDAQKKAEAKEKSEKLFDFDKSFGIEQPKLEVAVKLDDGKEQGLQIGTDNSFDNTLYAKKLGDSTVRVIDAYQKTALEKTAFDLRDKKVAHLDDAAELKRIDVAGVKSPYVLEKDGTTWKVNGAAADAGAADRVASALKSLRATAVAAEKAGSLKEFGLDKPKATVKL